MSRRISAFTGVILLVCTLFVVHNINATNRKLFGNKIGKWHTYYKNGSVKETMRYNLFGKQVKEYIRYHENGKVNVIGNYNKGEKNGTWQAFTNAGRLKEFISMDGYLSPPSFEWYFLTNSNSCKFTKKGLYKYYNTEGKLIAKGKIKNGHRVGVWEMYYSDGSLFYSGRFKNNIRHGEWTYFHANGNKKETLKYNDGHMVSDWNFFDEDGRKTKVISHDKNGDIVGKWYASTAIEKASNEAEFINFYIANSSDEEISSYDNKQTIYLTLITKGKINDGMSISLVDDKGDEEVFKISDKYIYNIAIENYIIKSNKDAIPVVPERLYEMDCICE